ncbi:MAG: hypothetical protein GY716_25785 [bacterium]|nr:hypothetical protein [bacterium]
MRRNTLIATLLVLGAALSATAAEPPGLVNYQGVLRDASGLPIDGSRDMVFRFYDADGGPTCSVGTLLLTDAHEAAGAGTVVLGGGQFSVLLGSGTVTAGTEPSVSEMFGDQSSVWLEVEVAGENLCPRIRVGATGFALNADLLDGIDSTGLLNTSAAPQTKSGDLTVSDLTVSGGDLDLGAGADDDLTATDVTTLTGGGVADALHTHASLGGVSASSATITGDLQVDSSAFLDRFLYMESAVSGEADGDSIIWFYENNSRTGESLRWNDFTSAFHFTDALQLEGPLQVGNPPPTGTAYNAIGGDDPSSTLMNTPRDLYIDNDLEVGTNLLVNRHLYMESSPSGEADGSQTIWFYDDNSRSDEWFRWDEAGDNFAISNSLVTVGPIQTGVLPGSSVAYNAFGGFSPESGAMLTAADVFVGSDLEVGASTYLNRTLYMEADASGVEADGDQNIWFYEGGSRTGEYLRWNDSLNQFYFSDQLSVLGALTVRAVPSSAGALFLGDSGIELRAEGNDFVFIADFDDDQADCQWRWNNDTTNLIDRAMELESDGDLFIGGTLFENTSFDVAEGFLKGETMHPGQLVRIDPARPDSVRLTRGVEDRETLGVVSTNPGIVLGGSAFSVEAIREVWGEGVAREFEQRQDELKRELLASDGELQARHSRLDSLEAYSAHVASQQPPEELEAVEPQAGSELAEMYDAARFAYAQDMLDGAIRLFFEKRFAPIALSGRVPVQVDASFGAIMPGDYLTSSPVPGVAMKATRPGPIVGTALEALEDGRGQVLTFVHRGHYTPGAAIETAKREIAEQLEERTADPATGIQSVAGNLQLVLDRDADDRARFSVFRNGESDLGNELLRVDEEGNLHVKGAVRPSSLDLAEFHPVNEPVEIGDVLVLDMDSADVLLRKGREPADSTVVGIVSAEPGLLLGAGMTRIADADPRLARQLDEARAIGDLQEEARLWHELERRFERTHAPLALSGTVDCKVDAGYGAIRKGDLLTSSATPGHAMRADAPRPGTIIGKALESLETGTGTVKVLVMLR